MILCGLCLVASPPVAKKRSERGAVLVEFVLILPVFILLLFGGLDMAITVNGAGTFHAGVQEGASLIAAGDQAPSTGPCVTNMTGAPTLGTAQALCEVTDAIGSVSGVDLSTLQLAIICKDASGSLLLTTGCGANPTDPPASFVVCARAHLHSVTGLTADILDGLSVTATAPGTIHGYGTTTYTRPTFDAYNSGGSDPLACPSGTSGTSYTVTFGANKGSGTMPPETSNTQTALSPNLFTAPTGDDFLDWNTQPSGIGTSYADQGAYPFTANATLYAQWGVANTYTVTYEAINSDGKLPDSGAAPTNYKSPYPQGATVTVIDNTGVPPLGMTGNHPFKGWCTTDTAANDTICNNGNSYIPGATFIISGNVTLYAQWN